MSEPHTEAHGAARKRPPLWAFSDESERAATVSFGILLIDVDEVAAARKALRGLLLPGQRQVHTAKESPRRRRELIDVVSGLRAESVVFTLRRPAGLRLIDARDILLAATARLAVEREVRLWHFDRQEPRQAARDRHVVESITRDLEKPPTYDHLPAAGEPLLWAIDAVLWAANAGGDWRRRIGNRVAVVEVEP